MGRHHRLTTLLSDSTRQVFDECASEYIAEDNHWGSDLDLICHYAERFREPEVIDLGAGNAWHLANLFLMACNGLRRAVGIDYSDKMVEMARNLLSSKFHDGVPLLEKVEVRKADIRSIPFDHSTFDIALLLNNTLGNIPGESFERAADERRKVLGETGRILRESGILIVSVYNSAELNEQDKYGRPFELDRHLSQLATFDLVVTYNKTGTSYYSHWFSVDEIQGLLIDRDFEVLRVETRGKRIIVSAQKRSTL